MKKFETYNQKKEVITENDNVYQMYVMCDGIWQFRGLVSERAKNTLQTGDTIKTLNERYREQEILASFSGKPVEETSTTYLFLKCGYAEVSTFKPKYTTS